MSGSVGYNINHIQIGPHGDPIDWIDVRGSQNWEPSIDIDVTPLRGDGGIYTNAYGAPEGSGDLQFLDPTPDVFAALNGGVISSSGTGETAIERYEQPGTYVAPPFAIADWIPNIARDRNPDTAGMRTTAPNATATPLSRTSGQETAVEWTTSTSFTPDEDNQLLIYEWLASEPVFTDGVMPVNLTRPTP